jgi:hypothetical protein
MARQLRGGVVAYVNPHFRLCQTVEVEDGGFASRVHLPLQCK